MHLRQTSCSTQDFSLLDRHSKRVAHKLRATTQNVNPQDLSLRRKPACPAVSRICNRPFLLAPAHRFKPRFVTNIFRSKFLNRHTSLRRWPHHRRGHPPQRHQHQPPTGQRRPRLVVPEVRSIRHHPAITGTRSPAPNTLASRARQTGVQACQTWVRMILRRWR